MKPNVHELHDRAARLTAPEARPEHDVDVEGQRQAAADAAAATAMVFEPDPPREGLLPGGSVDEPAGYVVTPAGEAAVDEERARQIVARLTVTHALAGGSFGGPGENEARCVCGVTYSGFDTHGEAAALVERHIADEYAASLPAPTAFGPASVETEDDDRDQADVVRIPAGDLTPGTYVATGDPMQPGVQVRYVEHATHSPAPYVGILFAGPLYREYDVDELVEIVDASVVEQAAAKMRAYVHRMQQIDGLRELARIAEADDTFPLPPFTLRLDGGLRDTDEVRRFAAALGLDVAEDGYGLRSAWEYGSDLIPHTPALRLEVSAAHRHHPTVSGRAAVPAGRPPGLIGLDPASGDAPPAAVWPVDVEAAPAGDVTPPAADVAAPVSPAAGGVR